MLHSFALFIRYTVLFSIATEVAENRHETFSPTPWVLVLPTGKEKRDPKVSFSLGGGHGTRTRGAVTPYSLSRRAP